MKKVLSVLGLIAIIGMTTPVMAAPGGPGGPGGGHGGPGMHGGPAGGGRHISAGTHHGHHMRPHGGVTIHAGYPRHSHWRSCRGGYWGGPCCDHRLGWYGDYYYRPCGGPFGNIGFSIRF